MQAQPPPPNVNVQQPVAVAPAQAVAPVASIGSTSIDQTTVQAQQMAQLQAQMMQAQMMQAQMMQAQMMGQAGYVDPVTGAMMYAVDPFTQAYMQNMAGMYVMQPGMMNMMTLSGM